MTRANFRDPLGLAWRMLRSPKRTARSVLIREALSIALKPVDFALTPFERTALRAIPNTQTDTHADTPAIFIVGGPRSGTTVTYQLLARHLPVTYTSNWTACFPHAPITAGRIVPRWIQRPRSHANKNYFGNVSGLDGPNDAFAIWNRWLGDVRGKPEPLTPEAREEIRRFFAAWHRAFAKPILNKNNRNTLCIADLARALPGARFVVVRRDPVYVAQSLIESRREVQGDDHAGWGLLNRDADPSDPMGHVHAVCAQIEDVESRLRDQLAAVPPDRVVELQYEDTCAAPARAIERVQNAFLPGQALNPGTIPTSLICTNHDRLTPAELEAIRARTASLWNRH